MATTYVNDVSDDSALECDVFSSVSDEESFDSAIFGRPCDNDVTRFSILRPDTDRGLSGHRTETKKSRRRRNPSAKCKTASVDSNRKTPVIGDATNKRKGSCQKLPVPSNRVTSGASSPYHHQTEMDLSTSSATSRKDRLLMRPWLELMANERVIANMTWYNEERTQIKIPWKHGSRSCWTIDDSQLYREWAKHTGKFSESKGDEPKRWKANFRCALNSLPDVVEVKNVGQARGNNPYKVYELLQQVNKKSSPRRPKRTRRSKSDGVGKQPPLAATTKQISEKSPTGRKTSASSRRLSRLSAQPNVTQRNFTVSGIQRSSLPVIPTVVEEMSDMSQGEWNATPSSEVSSHYNSISTSETSEATDFLQSQLDRRLHSSTPSESSGYGTDSGMLDSLETNILPEDFYLSSELAIATEMPEFNMEDTHAYQFQLLESVPLDDVTYCELR